MNKEKTPPDTPAIAKIRSKAKWKELYNNRFNGSLKKERNTIQKVNILRSEVKLYLAIYGDQTPENTLKKDLKLFATHNTY